MSSMRLPHYETTELGLLGLVSRNFGVMNTWAPFTVLQSLNGISGSCQFAFQRRSRPEGLGYATNFICARNQGCGSFDWDIR